jgi:hypothetical protein
MKVVSYIIGRRQNGVDQERTRMLCPKKEEATGRYRKVYNMELNS